MHVTGMSHVWSQVSAPAQIIEQSCVHVSVHRPPVPHASWQLPPLQLCVHVAPAAVQSESQRPPAQSIVQLAPAPHV